jgi:peptidoglycan/LPS O-acetylase OafA/YrhL
LWPRISGGIEVHNFALVFAAQLAVAIALASILHFAVERPFLLIKNRFHVRKSEHAA